MDRRDALTLIGATMLAPASALAWVPPTRLVVKRAQTRMQAAAGQRVRLEGRAWPGQAAEAIEARWSLGARPTFVVRTADGRQCVVGPSGQSGEAALALDRLTRLALTDLFGPKGVRGLISRLGISGRRQRLALHGERVAVVVGARRGDGPDRSQVWIDQATFAVLRVRTATGAGVHDLELLDWESPITQGRFPSRVRVRQSGRWLRALTVIPQ